jgi:Ca2+-binding RTX toxin-like protein
MGGADLITLSAVTGYSAGAAEINGGAGGDTITITDVGSGIVLNGGDGSDLIDISSGESIGSIAAGAGSDTISIASGTVVSAVTLGAGADYFSAATGSIAGNLVAGGGADTIILETFSKTGSILNADSSVNGGGTDLVTVSGLGDSTNIKGKGGSDTITVTFAGSASTIAGNAGGDLISVSGIAASGVQIQAGSGNDTISLAVGAAVASGTVVGGGGADSITVSGAEVEGLTYKLGAGSDTLLFTGGTDATDLGTVVVSSLSDSTVSTLDTINAVTGVVGAQSIDFDLTSAGFANSAVVAIASGTSTAAFTTGVGVTGSISGGVMTIQNTVTSLPTMAGYADTATTKQGAGATLLFSNGVDSFLFVQGGSAGTGDDYVAKIASGVVASGDLSIANGIADVDFIRA